MLPLAHVIAGIREAHRERRDYHAAEKKLTLQVKAIQRREHQQATGCQKKGHASCLGVYEHLPVSALAIMEVKKLALEPKRKLREKQMEQLARQLPLQDFVAETRGFGLLSYAQIIAECGDLSNYANPAKLWARMGMGLAPDGATVYEGRSPTRRAIMYCIGDCLIKAGGSFKALYNERKVYEATKPPCRKPFKNGDECFDAETGACRPKHLHNRAKRYMEKRLLRELWRQWPGGPGPSDSGAGGPVAPPSAPVEEKRWRAAGSRLSSIYRVPPVTAAVAIGEGAEGITGERPA